VPYAKSGALRAAAIEGIQVTLTYNIELSYHSSFATLCR